MIFPAPRRAATPPAPAHKILIPLIPAPTPKSDAWRGDIAFLTSGRVRVRIICASNGTSEIWLKVFAEAEHSAVPKAVESKTGIVAGRGDSATPDMAVKTTRIDSRALES